MDETPPVATPVEADAPSPDGFIRADLVAAGTVLGFCFIGFLLMLLMLPFLASSALIPTLLRARQDGGRAACQSNLHAIGQAMQLYMNDNNAQAPPDLDSLVKGEYVAGKTLKCPSADTLVDCDYFYYCRGRPWELPRAGETIVACDFAWNHRGGPAHLRKAGGRNVLYADGSARWRREAEFASEVYERQNQSFAVRLRMGGDDPIRPMLDDPD